MATLLVRVHVYMGAGRSWSRLPLHTEENRDESYRKSLELFWTFILPVAPCLPRSLTVPSPPFRFASRLDGADQHLQPIAVPDANGRASAVPAKTVGGCLRHPTFDRHD